MLSQKLKKFKYFIENKYKIILWIFIYIAQYK